MTTPTTPPTPELAAEIGTWRAPGAQRIIPGPAGDPLAYTVIRAPRVELAAHVRIDSMNLRDMREGATPRWIVAQGWGGAVLAVWTMDGDPAPEADIAAACHVLGQNADAARRQAAGLNTNTVEDAERDARGHGRADTVRVGGQRYDADEIPTRSEL